jgi:cardiolipin synthase A/B
MLFSTADTEVSIAQFLTALVLILDMVCLVWILHIKREPLSAMSWCMAVIFLPLAGGVLFILFGYQNIHRPIRRKRDHAKLFRARASGGEFRAIGGDPKLEGWAGISTLAQQLGADPAHPGHCVEQFHDVAKAYENMLATFEQARHHIHLEMFIFRSDESGRKFMNVLAEKVRQGVKVRLLFDGVGSWNLSLSTIRILRDAGGQVAAFLPLSLLRRKFQINLRNHRKIVVVDGRVGFTGGCNIGDEYLGKHPFFGHWRDSWVRIEGPSVLSMQKVFLEDWDFATDEDVLGDAYFPAPKVCGDATAQIAWSGPDQELKTIREILFAGITRARKRIWIATPYFVPDAALLDALSLAARSGVDVRLLVPFRPDKWVPFLAAKFYWQFVLPAGVKVYQYAAGFMHAKLVLIDDRWSSIGSANFDNRSLLLNFELNALIESEEVARDLEAAFLKDFEKSARIDQREFERRPFVGRIVENACRLVSPIL